MQTRKSQKTHRAIVQYDRYQYVVIRAIVIRVQYLCSHDKRNQKLFGPFFLFFFFFF